GEIEEREVEVVTGQFLERLFHRFGDNVSVSPVFEKTECRLPEGGIRTNEQGVVVAHASPRSLRGCIRGQAAVLSVCVPHARDFIHRRATTPERRSTSR